MLICLYTYTHTNQLLFARICRCTSKPSHEIQERRASVVAFGRARNWRHGSRLVQIWLCAVYTSARLAILASGCSHNAMAERDQQELGNLLGPFAVSINEGHTGVDAYPSFRLTETRSRKDCFPLGEALRLESTAWS